jgi:hypothetical protein
VGEDVESLKVGNEKKKSLLQAQGRLDLGERMAKVETGLQNLGTDIEARRFGNSLVSARMREELDAITNINTEDRLIFTGMINKVPIPQGFQDKKKWVLDMVGEVLNRIEQGSAEKIIWANQGRRNEREIPMAEVKMKSKEDARRIRLKFAERKRSGGKLWKAVRRKQCQSGDKSKNRHNEGNGEEVFRWETRFLRGCFFVQASAES